MLINASVQQVHSVLRHWNALIVHFSGTPKGAGYSTRFPKDLQDSITNSNTFSLSCSTVMPGDYFGYDHSKVRNATGNVGIIIDILNDKSLMNVNQTDAGSLIDRNNCQVSIHDCMDSIIHRQGYNEWNVSNYFVRGIFVHDPITIFDECIADGPDDVPIEMRKYPGQIKKTLDDIMSIFPDQRIYSFFGGNIFEFTSRKVFSPAFHQEIYK